MKVKKIKFLKTVSMPDGMIIEGSTLEAPFSTHIENEIELGVNTVEVLETEEEQEVEEPVVEEKTEELVIEEVVVEEPKKKTKKTTKTKAKKTTKTTKK